jgi:hypothetical protein
MALAAIKELTLCDPKTLGASSGSGASSGTSSARTTTSSGGAVNSSSGGGVSAAGASPAALTSRSFPGCHSLVLRPRTMEDLGKLVSGVLVGRPPLLPSLSSLRLELSGVYAKQCDLSLTLKSVALRCKGLTHLHLEQPACYTTREAAAVAELPALTHLQLVSTRGVEPGALVPLGAMPGLRHLHLQLTDEEASAPSSPAATGAAAAAPTAAAAAGGSTPVSQAAAWAADAAALRGMTHLASITLVGMQPPVTPGCPWAVECLLTAATAAADSVQRASSSSSSGATAAGGQQGGVRQLRIMECGALTPALLEVVSRIHTLASLSLGDVSDAAALVSLSRLGALEGLALAPGQALPSSVLSALLSSCPRLGRLLAGGLGPCPSARPGSAQVSELQLVRPAGTAPAAPAATTTSSSSSSHHHSALVRGYSGGGGVPPPSPPAALGSLPSWLPGLSVLALTGWSLDASAVDAVMQLKQLTHLLLNPAGSSSSSDPSDAASSSSSATTSSSSSSGSQPADVLLPLLRLPHVRQLQLLGLSGLTDAWVASAVSSVGTPGGAFPATTHLALGAAPDPTSLRLAAAAGSSASLAGAGPTKAASAAAAAAAAMAATAVFEAAAAGLTDKGLVKLFPLPRLAKLELVSLPGVTLAGVKALARGCPPLRTVVVRGVPSVAAAHPDVLVKAGVTGDGRVVDILVRH